MNDVIWYSRFAVLVGALVLLVQAIAGRGTSLITLVGILLLCLGFVVFITALSLQGLRWSPRGNRAGTNVQADPVASQGEEPAETLTGPAPDAVERPQTDAPRG